MTRTRAMLAALVAAPLLLTGCSGTSAVDADGAGDYQFGRLATGPDGLFPAAERGPAPELVGETLQGEPLDVGSLRGDVVVLNFWADWCGPCRAEAPFLNAVAERTKDEGVRFVGVNVKDDRNAALAFERVDLRGAFSAAAALTVVALAAGAFFAAAVAVVFFAAVLRAGALAGSTASVGSSTVVVVVRAAMRTPLPFVVTPGGRLESAPFPGSMRTHVKSPCEHRDRLSGTDEGNQNGSYIEYRTVRREDRTGPVLFAQRG